MNKITTLIVDNDSASAKKLRADLAAFPEIEIQEIIPTAERANLAIIEAQPDFLFLEIELSDILLKSYSQTELTQIIKRFYPAESKDLIYVERCLRKVLSLGPKFGIQTISNLMLLRYEDILLFRYEGMPRFWYMLLTNCKYLNYA